MVNIRESRWNRYRVWKPLSLLVLAGLNLPEWDISIIDENLGVPDYAAMPRPDLVGITAFTSQANRAYNVAAYFRNRGVPRNFSMNALTQDWSFTELFVEQT